jgi:hypothetical protein
MFTDRNNTGFADMVKVVSRTEQIMRFVRLPRLGSSGR